jgi:hypothetical protein
MAIEFYSSDDYAGASVHIPGKLNAQFYYGWEETVPIPHGDDEDWAFVATLDDQEIVRIGGSSLDKLSDRAQEPCEYLALGMALFFEKIAEQVEV